MVAHGKAAAIAAVTAPATVIQVRRTGVGLAESDRGPGFFYDLSHA